MNYRHTTILARKTEAADVTETIDIDIKDPISQLVVTHESTQGESGSVTMHPAACIAKIELVDGSDVLYSLSGVEAQGVDFYHNLKEPGNQMIYLNTMNSEMVFILNFGRYLWDPLLALDPKEFTNLQLKVTIDVNGGGMNTSTGYLTILAKCFDEKKISPVGFLQHKEIKSYTLANSSWEYTDLPTDYPIRKLLIRARRDAVGFDYQLANIKLHEDNLKRVVLDYTIGEVMRSIVTQTPPYREGILMFGSNTAVYGYCTPAYLPKFSGCGWRATANIGSIAIYEGDGQRYEMIMDTYAGNIQLHCEGWCPQAMLQIPFGLQDTPEDWYDVTKVGNLKLEIKGGSDVGTSQTAEIVLQQLRKY